MGKYIKNFDTHEEYLTYSEIYLQDNEYRPNVSHCKDLQEMHYNGVFEETRVKATFKVLNSSADVKLTGNTTNISEIYIDGAKQDNVVSSYVFNTTGEHEVKYKLIDKSYVSDDFCSFCYLLNSVDIPNSVTSIENTAFYSCYGLTSINIPDSVTSIGYAAFYSCTGLTSINIPDSVTFIGDAAFSDCDNLTSINLSNSLTGINYGTFYNCRSLISIDLPDSVTYISTCAFAYCSSLTSINIPDSVTYIGSYAFAANWGATNYALESLYIPNSVTAIGEGICINRPNLTYIEIGNGVTEIPKDTCYYCKDIKHITLGTNVTYIGENAFGNISKLDTITCKTTNPPTLNTAHGGVFYSTDLSETTIYVPSESVDNYKYSSSWWQFADKIQSIE